MLTFDDGPDARWTPHVLRTLKKYHVPGAFFMVGLQMEKNLPIVRKVYDAGFTIGNHTFTHHNIIENSESRTYAELEAHTHAHREHHRPQHHPLPCPLQC